ncbi:hypothetical protein QUF74_19065 [Candidatus Halobeggiatoa sp. HSG11]|nr:hypothetical protein [Candidatus Halobeggiatoa sp. HSG11]
MKAIEFDSYASGGNIKIPVNYQDWHGARIKVILLQQDDLTSETRISSRPIGLAEGKFKVPPQFFEELPKDMLDTFEGKR